MRKKGYTIVEMLAALAIVSVIVIGIYLSIILTTRLQLQAKHTTIAAVEAEKAIELERDKAFDNLAIGTTTASVAELPNGQKAVTISSVNDDLKKIVVTVTWSVGGSNRSVALETLGAKGGINDITQ